MASSDRVLAILTLFTATKSEWTVEEAAKAVGQPVSTTYKHFAILAKTGFLDTFGAARYVLGPAAIQLDWIIRQTDPLLSAAEPAMQILAGAVDFPAVILLCRLYRGQVMCVSQQSSANPRFASGYQRGRPMPLTRGAASKAVLAYLPDRTKGPLIDKARAAHPDRALASDPEALESELTAIREKGFALTSGEVDEGLTGVAVPLLAGPHSPLGCIAFVVSNAFAIPTAVDQMVRLLKSASRQISDALAQAA